MDYRSYYYEYLTEALNETWTGGAKSMPESRTVGHTLRSREVLWMFASETAVLLDES